MLPRYTDGVDLHFSELEKKKENPVEYERRKSLINIHSKADISVSTSPLQQTPSA